MINDLSVFQQSLNSLFMMFNATSCFSFFFLLARLLNYFL